MLTRGWFGFSGDRQFQTYPTQVTQVYFITVMDISSAKLAEQDPHPCCWRRVVRDDSHLLQLQSSSGSLDLPTLPCSLQLNTRCSLRYLHFLYAQRREFWKQAPSELTDALFIRYKSKAEPACFSLLPPKISTRHWGRRKQWQATTITNTRATFLNVFPVS